MSKEKKKQPSYELVIYTYENTVYRRMEFNNLTTAREVRSWYEERGFKCILKENAYN